MTDAQPNPQPEAPPATMLQRKGETWQPQNMREGMEYAKWLAQSSLIPAYLRGKPHDVMVVALAGRDYGLTFTQAMTSVIVVEGKVALSAALIVGLCKKNRECVYFRIVESDSKHAIWETQRHGSPAPTRLGFTIADAAAMGLDQRSNWKKQPETMLLWRCATRLARMEYPDLVLNLLDIDEAGDSGMLRLNAATGNWQPPEPAPSATAPGGNVAPAAQPAAAGHAGSAGGTTTAAPGVPQAAPTAATQAQEPKRGPGRPRKAAAVPHGPQAAPAAAPSDAQPELGEPSDEETLDGDGLEDETLGDDGEGEPDPNEIERGALLAMKEDDRQTYFGRELYKLAEKKLPLALEPDRYDAFPDEVRKSYWLARFSFASNEAELRQAAKGVKDAEPDGSAVRKGLGEVYNAKLRSLGVEPKR